MSFRLTPNAQRKNKVVTRISGVTYFRSVIGAEFDMEVLGQGPIKVHVATVYENVLAGDVTRLGRKEKYYHRGDFVGSSHSLFQRNFRKDGFEFFFGLRKCVEPLPVQRRHNLGGNDCVHADAVSQQLGGPFPGES